MTALLQRAALVPLLLAGFLVVVDRDAASSRAAETAARIPQLSANPVAVQPGATLTLEGRGFPRNAHIALLARPPRGEATRIGGATTGLRGRFSATIHIRPRASAGRFVALACVERCDVKASTSFRIVVP